MQKAGSKFEQQFFGCSADQFPKPEYRGLHESLDIVARIQVSRGWDPRKPSTPKSKRLFLCVCNYLDDKDALDLQLYCAIGTSLDRFHGADGFFRIRTHIVLLDLTVRRDKIQRKSVIFKKSDFTERKLNNTARQIARLLNASITRAAECRSSFEKLFI